MERINVAVRAKPLSPEDAKTSPWRISGNSILFANPPIKFDFDRVFKEDCRIVDIYESRTKDIVSAAIGGFNGTVFAYGQTNSGKTHTMRGSSVEPGVIPLAVHDLFGMIQLEVDREFLLRMSYMEIYNEEINDLLAPEHRKLKIHESIERGIFVAGLREEIVTSPKQVLEFMEFGEAHRHIWETNVNLHSSRSHTIFRMIIESRDKAEDEYSEGSCDPVRVSVLNLVDLAGSERAGRTGAEGIRLKEGSHINKSLMTLGTVIKKLSEGAESQRGHVPYRDSKLTRILQPSLGGNANTAIICTIILAQSHADETKSSLQFASRALRVTNRVHVNEILTTAALLKRQKKEIEELRAKLQGSHSDHLGAEILNLRNTLLQSELERERITLELEEEKKAQAERDRMLLEQAKKIQNLSSMILCSSRDEVRDRRKKEKWRGTWCPGKLLENTTNELPSTIPGQASAMEPIRTERERGPLLPFKEIGNENTLNACKQERDCNITSCDFGLPSQRSLIHVTTRKKSLPKECAVMTEMRAKYENLLLQFQTQRTMSELQIDYLTRRLAEADEKVIQLSSVESFSKTESLLVKQLKEKISMLERGRSSCLQHLESDVELLTEENTHASKKHEEDENAEVLTNLLVDIQEMISDIQHLKTLVESMMDEHLQSCTALSELIADVRSFSSIDFIQIKTLLSDYEKVHSCMKTTVDELEYEKVSKELEAFREECKVITEKLALAEEKVEVEKAHSVEKSLEIERLRNDIRLLDDQKRLSENKLRSQLLEITQERDEAMAKAEELQNFEAEQPFFTEGCNDKLLDAKAEAEELTMKLSALEVKRYKIADKITYEFTTLFDERNMKKYRLTIPSWFVEMHRLERYNSCLLLFDRCHYAMKLQAYGDTRRPTTNHVVILGNFRSFKHTHNLSTNKWLKFILDLDDKREDYRVIFNVTEFG